MRIKGLIFLVVVIAIVVVLGLLFTDRWLETRLERLGTGIVGAKVEIDHLDVSLLGLHMRWDSLQVTDPKQTMKNMLTTGETGFDLQMMPLLSKKVIIDDIMATNVTSGTDRTTDGKIEKKPKKKEKKPNVITKTIDRLQDEVKAAPAWNIADFSQKVNADSILKIMNITSPDKIDSLRSVLSNTYQTWDSTFQAVNWQGDLQYLESRVTSIDPASIQTVDGLQTALRTLDTVNQKVDSLETVVIQAKREFQSDLDSTRYLVGQVDDWIAADYQNALAKAKLPDLGAENIAQFIFGGKVVSQATQVLNLVNTAREYSAKFKSDKPKKENPPRLKGQTIYFTAQQKLPSFWIKKVSLSGHTTRGLKISGELLNVVSQQKVIGVPTTFAVGGERGDGASLDINGELNYLGESPSEQISFKMAGMPMNQVRLSESALFPRSIEKGRGMLDWRLKIGGDQLIGNLDLEADRLDFEFAEVSGDKMDETIRRIFTSLNRIDLQASLQSTDEKTEFGLNSNIDDVFANELKNIVGEEIAAARERIENEVDSRVSEKKAEFDAYVAEKTESLEQKMNELQELIDTQKQMIEDKKQELEERIEEEKSNLKEEAKDKLKGLFDN